MSNHPNPRTVFIGPVASTGGPAIKNAIMLQMMGTSHAVKVVNTYSTSATNRVSYVAKTALCKADQVIVGVSRKGRSLLWPIVANLARCGRVGSYALVCIGGTIAEEAQGNRKLVQAMLGASLVAVETDGVAQKLKELNPEIPVYLFTNFVDGLDAYPKAEIGAEGPVRFVFLSSVRNKKGVATMLRAFERVLDAGADAILDIYGPIKSDFDISLFDGLCSGGPVKYLGEVKKSQVGSILSQYDCFVFPSEYEAEGFPSVLAEAMAAGLPVIASDVCYNAEIVGDGGFIFPSGDAEALSSAMLAACADRTRLVEISKRNRRESARDDAHAVVGAFVEKLKEKGWAL